MKKLTEDQWKAIALWLGQELGDRDYCPSEEQAIACEYTSPPIECSECWYRKARHAIVGFEEDYDD